MKFLLFLISFSLSVSLYAQHDHHRIILDRKTDYALYIKDASKIMQPGDTIQLAGRYKSVKINNLAGTPENPVIIINKGHVVIEGVKPNTAVFTGKYFKVLGNGDPNYTYGIHFTSFSKNADVDFALRLENSTNAEVAFCEISQVVNGILHNPPSGSSSVDCYIHNNYIHDIGDPKKKEKGNGIYLTASKPEPGKSVWVFQNYRIENNKLESITGNALFVSNGYFSIKDNIVSKFALSGLKGFNTGIILGINANGKITGNKIDSAKGKGLDILGFGEVEVSGNKFASLSVADLNEEIVFINGLFKAEAASPLLKLAFLNNSITESVAKFAVTNITKPGFTNGSVFQGNKITGDFKKTFNLISKDKIKN